MKKLVFISNIAAPYQIKLCYGLQPYFDTEFWFYDRLGDRPEFWKIPLGEKCRIIKNVIFKKKARYFTLEIIKMLNNFQPDIVMLGGFTIPSNYIAYLWAVSNKKIIFTERSRDKCGKLRKGGFVWELIRSLYRKIDLIMVSDQDIVPQFRDDFKFGNKVVAAQYPSDIDSYFLHNLRGKKELYSFLFPNRLIEIYNPLGAIKIFSKICLTYPNSKLFLNNEGELKNKCKSLINELDIENNVFFLDSINNWNDLHLVYKDCDILLFPAEFSNGNFTILESMASGLGIVISENILGVGELIENGKNGFRCVHVEENYIDSVLKYIKNPELFIKHAELNRNIVRKYSILKTADLYNKIIMENIKF